MNHLIKLIASSKLFVTVRRRNSPAEFDESLRSQKEKQGKTGQTEKGWKQREVGVFEKEKGLGKHRGASISEANLVSRPLRKRLGWTSLAPNVVTEGSR